MQYVTITLTNEDYARAAIRAKELGIPVDGLAQALLTIHLDDLDREDQLKTTFTCHHLPLWSLN